MPEPIIIGGFEENANNIDSSENPEVENIIESTRFSFAPRNEPTTILEYSPMKRISFFQNC